MGEDLPAHPRNHRTLEHEVPLLEMPSRLPQQQEDYPPHRQEC